MSDHAVKEYIDKRRGKGRWEGKPHKAPQKRGRHSEPFIHYVIVAPSSFHLDVVRRKMQEMLGLAEDNGWIVYQDPTGSCDWLRGMVRIDYRNADRPLSLVSDHYERAWLDECARMKEAAWDQNIRPAFVTTGAPAVLTSTPLGRGDWWHRTWSLGDVKEAAVARELYGGDFQTREDYRCIHWTTMDNESVEGISDRALADRGRIPDALWKQNYTASWDAFIGQIFHLKPKPPKPRPQDIVQLSLGFDLGQDHPASLTLIGVTKAGVFHELDTIARVNFPYDREASWQRNDGNCWTSIARQMVQPWLQVQARRANTELWRSVPIYIPKDSGGPAIRQQFRDRGFRVKKAFQSPGSRHTRLVWAIEGLGSDRLHIHSSPCRRSVQSLVWKAEGKQKNEVWDPDKGGDDPWDSLGYALSPWIRYGLDAVRNPQIAIKSWG
jgi:hypothetical protein